MTLNTQALQETLQKELQTLEEQLALVGRKNPDATGDWEATENADTDAAEEGEVAGAMEEYETNSAVLSDLEIRLAEVKAALEKIGGESFGICETCGSEIEEDRMNANPAAKTCKAHMN